MDPLFCRHNIFISLVCLLFLFVGRDAETIEIGPLLSLIIDENEMCIYA